MKIGVLGGSGVYDLEGLRNVELKTLSTPFGAPSDAYVCGSLGGVDLCFLPRHGRGHRLLPSEINHRANIFGFKLLGVERVMSISAVGSLKDEYRPRDIVLPDQYFDRTKARLEHTFFGNGIVAHVSFGDPTCAEMRKLLAAAAREVVGRQKPASDVRVHESGTYVNMEGPAFSTRAESNAYRRSGFDIIGMTSLAEAKLCREAELCYQAMAMVTDYDCWHVSEEAVTVEMIIANLQSNAKLAKEILREFVAKAPACRGCGCGDSLRTAIMTDPSVIPAQARKNLDPIVGKYLPA